MARHIEQKLRKHLHLEDSGLVGCKRRNLWTSDNTSWRWIRGNALLALAGEKTGTHTPAGYHEFFHTGPFVLAFRGGPWKDYWVDDFLDLWSLAAEYWPHELSRTILVLHENAGELDIKYLPVPDSLNPAERVEGMLAHLRADPPGRISKGATQARHVCWYCPAKARCDATDRLRNETHDWSPYYPIP
jgi:hypothetical protein